MIISATSDLDPLGSDLFLFEKALKKAKKPDLLLFAGDMYFYKRPDQYKEILNLIRKQKWDCPIVACFGNREFPDDELKIKRICGKKIKFLENQSLKIKIKNKTIGIVGSRGCLDKPTFWQMTNIKRIYQRYKKIFHEIKNLLAKLNTDIKILLTHYSTTYKTLKGEPKELYGVLGSKYFEKAMTETNVTFSIHGHAHHGIPLAFVDTIPVFNVAFPVNKRIVEINPERLPHE